MITRAHGPRSTQRIPPSGSTITRAEHRANGVTEKDMTKRPGDKTPDPPGGRAAERLRMFEEARRPKGESPKRKKGTPPRDAPGKKGGTA